MKNAMIYGGTKSFGIGGAAGLLAINPVIGIMAVSMIAPPFITNHFQTKRDGERREYEQWKNRRTTYDMHMRHTYEFSRDLTGKEILEISSRYNNGKGESYGKILKDMGLDKFVVN